tara:strand:- start:238 stop:411 length:174 start_codon:yes stop_codon:yes gene_type:complete
MAKQNIYTLIYKVIEIGGKMKTVTSTYANLKEAKKAGREHFNTHVSLKNGKGISLPL